MLASVSFHWICSLMEEENSPVQEQIIAPCNESGQLMQPEQLQSRLAAQEDIFLIEVSKSEDFSQGHIPDARRIWRPDYEEKQRYPYAGMRADSQQVAALLRDLGYNHESHLVLYDRRGDVDAARFYWILRGYGHDNLSLLDGGIDGWQHRGYATSQEAMSVEEKGNFRFPMDRQLAVRLDWEDVQQALKDTSYIILDTRTLDEYEGKEQKKGAFLPGKIPGSIHLDWIECVEYNGDYSFKSCEKLEKLLANKGIPRDKKIITYCHSGVRSAHMAFVLTEIMGYPHVENYDGSWTEWSYYEELALRSDNKTIINN
jgi:thiosulfate/3-mercaptopyruvate sulfurtransferase